MWMKPLGAEIDINTRKAQRRGGLRGNPCKNQSGEERLSERSFNKWFIRYDALILREKPKSLTLLCIKNVKKSNWKNGLSRPGAKSGRVAQRRQSGCVPGGCTGCHSLSTSVLRSFSHVRFFATLWAAAHQAPLSVGFSRQECWSGFLCPSPKDLQGPGIERLPHWQAGCLPLAPPGKPRGSAHREQRHLLAVDSGNPGSQD